MKVKVGDDIAIDSDKVGTPPREGTVLEVMEADWGTRYRIAWTDGHESTIHPLGGKMHVLQAKEPELSPLAEVWR